MSYHTFRIISLVIGVIILLLVLATRNKDKASSPSHTNNGSEFKDKNKIKKSIMIGRHPNNDIVVHDPAVNKHCIQITQYEDGYFTLLDLKSTNGCCVNGKRIEGEVALSIGDVVTIGLDTVVSWEEAFGIKADER